jgi:hypothetical protein
MTTPVMRTVCSHEKGWHVIAEWDDGVTMTVYEPRNVPENKQSLLGNILDLRDCREFRLTNGDNSL